MVTNFSFLSFYLVDASNLGSPSSLHASRSCFVELPDFPSHRSLRVYIHREFFFFFSFFFLLHCIIIGLSLFSLILTRFYIKQTSSTQATGTGQSSSGGSAGSGTGSGGAASTGTSSQSSALSSTGVPPGLYALGLGLIAGVALVF